jgi:hypothetical protein
MAKYPKPRIESRNRYLSQLTGEILHSWDQREIYTGQHHLFRQGNILTRVIKLKEPNSASRAVLQEATLPFLRGYSSECALFYRKTMDGPKPTLPPDAALATIL